MCDYCGLLYTQKATILGILIVIFESCIQVFLKNIDIQ